MTAYNAVPEQTDSSPGLTASGAFSDPDIVAARSADLADELPFGTVIMITYAATSTPNCGIGLVDDQIGLRVIADSMHPRKRNQIDLLFDQTDKVKVGGKLINPARALGVCKDVMISVVGHIDIKHMPKNQMALRLAIGLLQIADAQPLAVSK
jgi:3D (Asp-Asp-Asp) domain-containing protein